MKAAPPARGSVAMFAWPGGRGCGRREGGSAMLGGLQCNVGRQECSRVSGGGKVTGNEVLASESECKTPSRAPAFRYS